VEEEGEEEDKKKKKKRVAQFGLSFVTGNRQVNTSGHFMTIPIVNAIQAKVSVTKC